MKHGWFYEPGEQARRTQAPVRWQAETVYNGPGRSKIPRRFTDIGKQRDAGILPS